MVSLSPEHDKSSIHIKSSRVEALSPSFELTRVPDAEPTDAYIKIEFNVSVHLSFA